MIAQGLQAIVGFNAIWLRIYDHPVPLVVLFVANE
jgi:hypothetical protein